MLRYIKAAGQYFKGIFNGLNLCDSYLKLSANERAKSLAKIVKLVDSIDYQDEAGKRGMRFTHHMKFQN
ncbi:hypothetical protein [Lactobacillus sp. ESL0246]|uniref:hypothetical protein n=2 Tax=Lactobacillus TaxID=1578 RepID=UPI001314D0FD|nr:hypothetical protein [Lactobacillus sp. ESL0246]